MHTNMELELQVRQVDILYVLVPVTCTGKDLNLSLFYCTASSIQTPLPVTTPVCTLSPSSVTF